MGVFAKDDDEVPILVIAAGLTIAGVLGIFLWGIPYLVSGLVLLALAIWLYVKAFKRYRLPGVKLIIADIKYFLDGAKHDI
jgi:hypothetical protein